MANGLPMLFFVTLPETPATHRIELEEDDRAGVFEGRLGIDQRIAGHHDPFADDVLNRLAVGPDVIGRQQDGA